ncbi:MAG: hypothetical protein AVDCRST_MAG93-7569, partial [uncultured Chloroflexia bacterium]
WHRSPLHTSPPWHIICLRPALEVVGPDREECRGVKSTKLEHCCGIDSVFGTSSLSSIWSVYATLCAFHCPPYTRI